MSKLYERVVKDDGKLTLAQMTKYNRMTGLDKDLAQIMNRNYGIVVASTDRLAEELYDASYFRYGWAFDQNSGVSLTWGSIPEEALEAVSHNRMDLIAKNTLKITQRNRIRSAISQGLLQGKSFPQMSRDIKKAMASNAYQALRIARTEGARAQSDGTAAIYEKAISNGVRGKEIWDAVLETDDKRKHKPPHQNLDGVPRPASGFWVLGGHKAARPLDFGIASYDIHCRCRLRFEVTGYAPQLRRTRDQGVIPYTTFADWKPGLSSRGKFNP
jgi:ribosomal protein S13